MKQFAFLFSFAILSAQTPKVVASAQSAVQTPLLGFALGTAPATLQPILGAVGAGGLGDLMPFPPALRTLQPAPRQPFALAEDGQGRLGIVTLDLGRVGDFTPIPGALANADRIAFCPNGSAAVLYSSTAQVFEVLTGLPAAPVIAGDFQGAALGKGVSAIALSDDASVVLAAVLTDSGGVVDSISAGDPRAVLTGANIAAIRFLPGSHNAVVADSQANRITLLSGDDFQPRVLAAAVDGVSGPLDLETSSLGDKIYVANTAANNLLILDQQPGSIVSLPCNFAPARITRLLRSAVSVTALDGSGIWVLDTDAANPWVASAPRLHE